MARKDIIIELIGGPFDGDRMPWPDLFLEEPRRILRHLKRRAIASDLRLGTALEDAFLMHHPEVIPVCYISCGMRLPPWAWRQAAADHAEAMRRFEQHRREHERTKQTKEFPISE